MKLRFTNDDSSRTRRTRRGKVLWLALLLLAASFAVPAQSTNDSSATDFSSFQIIVDRNIFNPDRLGRSAHHSESREAPTFTLAGTMSYRKGMFAFFNGTRDEYRKALQEGGIVAGFTVEKISFDGVQLQSSGRTIDMKVGAAMRREEGAWELRAPGEWGDLSTTETESGQPSQGASEISTNLPPGIQQNDVLKRLMEQRDQELK
ncbi:MAG: hypothetical protein ACRED1_00750 [Limisphaerales bacterium]